MRITRVKFENYKRLADRDLEVRTHLVLVGANDVGKSSLLRALNLILGASTAQLYANISIEDFRTTADPLVLEVELEEFSDDEKALFPDEIQHDPANKTSSLTIRLVATVDPSESIAISRSAPHAGTGRQLSRDQLMGLGWRFLSATAQTRDLKDGRRSALDELLSAVDLGDEKKKFDDVAALFQRELRGSEVLGSVRRNLAAQLSKALPSAVKKSDLSFVSGASADEDVLSDVRLQVDKEGEPHDLSQQSDGTRALYAIALYDMMSAKANVVGIDEPEIHLHPTSQRSLARLLKDSDNQKILATHSSDIVGAFEADSIVVVRPGGELVQPSSGFLSPNERTFVQWWVRDKLEPLTARRIITVEGLSDRIVLERAADRTDRNLDRLGVSVIETDGSAEINAIAKLFGPQGFDLQISRLIDLDAEGKTESATGIPISDFSTSSVWVSQKDLEDEYVRAIGATKVYDALKSSGQFTKNELSNCAPTGNGGTYTEVDVAGFCRKSKYKVRSALAILPIITGTNAKRITSIEGLLAEVVV